MAFAVLSAILLIQQTTRFAEVLGETEAPVRLALSVLVNLLPGVLIFSIPVATLVGISTGFGQMGHDSELTAMGAAGLGSLRLIAPAFALGCVLSALTLYVAFSVAPEASRNLRGVALQAALYKLESPVEPRSFYTGIPGKVIYIREGDKRNGEWQKIFMQWKEPDGQERLVTAGAGRLDFAGDRAELVLKDAVVTTLPPGGVEAIEKGAHVTLERSANMRLRDDRLNFGRDTLTRRMREREPELDELGWGGLLERADGAQEASRRREALIALNKKLALGLSPLLFAFFGACLGLKIVRGGRSQGILFSLAYMLIYYLLSLAGEQLARAGSVKPAFGVWLPFLFSVCVGGLLLFGRRRAFGNPFAWISFQRRGVVDADLKRGSAWGNASVLGLIDRAVFWSLVKNFLLTLSVLVFIFLIFTTSELLRFMVGNHVGASVLLRYLLYLLPYTFIAIVPIVTLLSVLITFAIMVRRNEVVAWWSSGQSVFRLILPCIFFAAILGATVWVVQDKIVPGSDRRQNALRSLIKTGAVESEAQPGRIWVSSPDLKHLYAYDAASINGRMSNLALYDFDDAQTHLTSIVISPQADAVGGGLQVGRAEMIDLRGEGAIVSRLVNSTLPERENLALNDELKLKKPSEFNFKALSAYIKTLKASGANAQALVVSLERRRAEPFFPLIMCLTAAPLALAFGRRGTLVALGVAVGAGLLFLGAMNALQELGSRDLLSAPVAIWSPSILFLAGGIYALSRSRT